MPTNTAPPREKLMRKALAAPAKAAPRHTVKTNPEGIVRAIVAVTGVVDAVDDLIVPGAFTESLAIRNPKVVDDHEWGNKAGRVLHIEEWLPGDSRLPKRTKEGRPWPAAAGALVATMQYNLNSTAGRESFEWVRFYAEVNEAEFSIGYKVPDGQARKRGDGVRVIIKVNLFELSHVLFGAAPLSMALEVKNMHGGTAGTVTRPGLPKTSQTTGNDDDESYAEVSTDETKPWDDDEDRAGMESKTAAAVVLEAKGHTSAPTPKPAFAALLEAKSMAAQLEAKGASHMKGSDEERHELIRQAAQDLLNINGGDGDYGYVSLTATYPAEVIVSAHGCDSTDHFFIAYTYDEATGTVELGQPEKVDLSLVAEPKGYAADPAAEYDAEELAVVKPMMDDLDRLWGISQVETKHGERVRARFAEYAATLQGKSADAEPEGDPEKHEADADTITVDTIPGGDWGVYRKTEPIEALRMDGPFTVETREGVVECSDGWLALDGDDFPYPIAADEFANVYEPDEDPEPAAGLEAEVEAPAVDADVETKTPEPEPEEEESVTIPAEEHEENMAALEIPDEDTDE